VLLKDALAAQIETGLEMKPTPKFDFPVGVWPETREHLSPASELYRGIYSVLLNHTVSIEFVPAFTRAPWPPTLPEDIDAIASSHEARRTTVALARYAVTADDARASTIEVIDGDGKHVVFYVCLADFDDLTIELQRVADELSGVHGAIAVSQLAAPALTKLLLDRILRSGHLTQYELYMLGRADRPS
jgi:hypothetical protein